MRAVHFERHGYRVQGIVTSQQIRCLCGLDGVVGLSQTVQMQRVAVGGTNHAVVDGHHAAREVYHVDGVALRIVVIVVALQCRDGEAILAVDVEHGVSESVAGLQRVTLALRPTLLLHTVGQCQLLLVTIQVLVAVVVFAEVVEVVEALLLVFDEHGRVVDAVVLGIILLHGVCHLVGGGLPCTLHHILVLLQRVAQVDDVAHLSVLEQGGIAVSGNLLYLPLHRWQQDLVFAGMYVGLHHHAVQRGVYFRLVLVFLILLVGCLVLKHLSAFLQVAVLDIEHQSRGIVAL